MKKLHEKIARKSCTKKLHEKVAQKIAGKGSQEVALSNVFQNIYLLFLTGKFIQLEIKSNMKKK